MKKKYEAIDGLRTFSCLGIVAMHVLANANYEVSGFVYEQAIPSMTNLVFLFMTISGFGMCCGYYEKFINGTVNIIEFYKKRYAKILPFFALLSFVDFAFSPSLNSLYEVFANVTLCFGLIPNANISVIGVGWFIGLVFVFYLIFPFYCFLLANKKRAWGSMVVALAMNFLCRNYFHADRTSIAYSFVFFLIGGLIYLYREEISKLPMARWIVLLLLFISVAAYFTFKGSIVIICILFMNAFALIFAMCVDGVSILCNKWTKFIGAISFEVYLCHMVIYRLVEKLGFLRLTSNEYLNYLIAYIVVITGAFCFAFFGKLVLEKSLKKVEILVNN